MCAFVMSLRYNIDYPDLYATAENCPNEANRKKFNCVQVRDHVLPHYYQTAVVTSPVPDISVVVSSVQSAAGMGQNDRLLYVTCTCALLQPSATPMKPLSDFLTGSALGLLPLQWSKVDCPVVLTVCLPMLTSLFCHAVPTFVLQRAHQNSLENQPIFLALLTISGLQVCPHCCNVFGGGLPPAVVLFGHAGCG